MNAIIKGSVINILISFTAHAISADELILAHMSCSFYAETIDRKDLQHRHFQAASNVTGYTARSASHHLGFAAGYLIGSVNTMNNLRPDFKITRFELAKKSYQDDMCYSLLDKK